MIRSRQIYLLVVVIMTSSILAISTYYDQKQPLTNSKMTTASTLEKEKTRVYLPTVQKTDPNFITNIYQAAKNDLGDLLEIRISRHDEPELWLNSVQITFDDAIQFDPAINNKRDIAYVQTSYSNSQTQVVLNGTFIEDGDLMLNFKTQLDDSALYWLKLRLYDNTNFVYKYDISTSKITRYSLGFIPSDLLLRDGILLVYGFNPLLDEYVVLLLDDMLDVITTESFHQSVIAVNKASGLKIITIEGSREFLAVFLAYHELFSIQRGEPFSYGNNYMGRLTWNETYRLLGLRALYDKTNDPYIAVLIRQTIANLLETARHDPYFLTKKYSLDRETPILLLEEPAYIYHSALASYDLLSPEQQELLLEYSKQLYSVAEKEWQDLYYFPSCIAYYLDGLPMPWNMQSIMGLYAIDLYRITGEMKYKDRVEQIYSSFIADLVKFDGTWIWHSMPSYYYVGWQVGDFESCNFPTNDPSDDALFEDNSHAAIDIQFLLSASEILDLQPQVSVDSIANLVTIRRNLFSRFISGDVDYQLPHYRFLPMFPSSNALRDYYSRLIILPSVDFDSQNLMMTYAQSATGKWINGDKLVLKEYKVNDDNKFEEVETLTLNYLDGSCILSAQNSNLPITAQCSELIRSLWFSAMEDGVFIQK